MVRPIFSGPKTVQASVTLLEQLPVLLEKTDEQELREHILPMVYLALESNMSQVQVSEWDTVLCAGRTMFRVILTFLVWGRKQSLYFSVVKNLPVNKTIVVPIFLQSIVHLFKVYRFFFK